MHRIPDKQVKHYLNASLGFSGSGRWRDTDLLTSALSIYQKVVGGGQVSIPFFLALDLRALTEFGNEFTYTAEDIPGFDKMLRARYENEILNRLLREHHVQQALEILNFHRIQGGDSSKNQEAFSSRADRLALLLLQRLAPFWPPSFALNAAHLRGRSVPVLEASSIQDSAQSWDEGRLKISAQSPTLEEQLSVFLDAVTGSSANHPPMAWSRVLQTQDLFELEHLEALNKEYLRQGARNIIDVMESLPVLDPHDIELREEESEVESLFMDESYYPTGGFSEITTRGSFENLVLSELIYMDEAIEERPEASKENFIDLFDLRFVESELLYYTRDSGNLQRKRRLVRIVLDMRDPLHIKYPEHPYQLGTLVAGMTLALVRDLALLFANDALLFHVHLLAGPEHEEETWNKARKQAEILEILLDAPIQRGTLQISLEEEMDWTQQGLHKRKTYALIFSANRSELQRLSPLMKELRKESPALFGTLLNLSGSPLDVHKGQEHLLHLGLKSSALHTLKHELLLNIMHSRKKQVHPDKIEENIEN